MKIETTNNEPSFIIELTLKEAEMAGHLANCVEIKDYCDIFGKDLQAFLEELGTEIRKAIVNNPVPY